jgi:hypothetical protein
LQDWLALSDREAPAGAGPAQIARGMFIVEFRLPLEGPTVLLSVLAGADRALSVFHDPQVGPAILVRSGKAQRRYRMDASMAPDLAGVARLSLWLDAAIGHWRMRFQVLDRSEMTELRGRDPLPFDGPLMQQLSDRTGGGHRHPSVLWFGLTSSPDLPKSAPWIGLHTPVETARGPVPAGLLKPGMGIRTLDHGLLPLKALRPMALPAAGSFAPVVLRQPFFAAERDLLVSADQLLLISGPSVEYLTGEEEVLVPAGALADGRVAERDNRRAVTHCVALDLGLPALVLADGCCLLSASPEGATLPRRTLRDWEMAPLLSLLGRTSLRPAA